MAVQPCRHVQRCPGAKHVLCNSRRAYRACMTQLGTTVITAKEINLPLFLGKAGPQRCISFTGPDSAIALSERSSSEVAHKLPIHKGQSMVQDINEGCVKAFSVAGLMHALHVFSLTAHTGHVFHGHHGHIITASAWSNWGRMHAVQRTLRSSTLGRNVVSW